MNWHKLVWLPVSGTVCEDRPKNHYELACDITIKKDPQEGPIGKNRSIDSMNWYKLTVKTY